MAESPSNKETELTMCDVLEEEQELEDDANAVLGGSDDTNCSYDKGYVSRQALYACKSCSVVGDAGVCLACCLSCHEGHETVELYTKRDFRCDCGNSKFLSKKCALKPDKDPVNAKNNYNHNFKGLYCSCRRPYPDIEDNIPDEMIQCIMCEDWYHGRHLGSKVPEEYSEMICQSCMESHRFLYSYLNGPHVEVEDDAKKPKSETVVNGVKREVDAAHSSSDQKPIIEGVPESSSDQKPVVEGVPEPSSTNLIKTEINPTEDRSKGIEQEHKSPIKEELDVGLSIKSEPVENTQCAGDDKKGIADSCILKKLHFNNETRTGSAFWPENWRKELCHCTSCMELYASTKCEFLLNPEDTIQAYEDRGRSSQSQYDKGLSALSQLDRVKQMEAVRAYTNMKGQLLEYLKEFADNKRTVCESDIKEFFNRMEKKQKLNNGVPHYCR